MSSSSTVRAGSGRSSPTTSRPPFCRRASTWSTTATPRPNRRARPRAVNGPRVRAYRATSCPSGSSTTSVKARGSPTGRGVPRASRSRPASSAAATRSTPPIVTAMARRAVTSSPTQAATSSVGPRGALAQLRQRQRPEHAQQVGDLLHRPGPPVLGQPLQLAVGAHHLLGVEQVGQPGARGVAAEQLGQQVGVERQRRGPALGQRGVALVEELRDVPEQQGARERRRLLGGDLDDPDLAGLQRPQHALEARDVEDVLQALAHGLEHDREGRVARGDLEQRRGALALLPQRLAPVGAAAGQQQRARRALAEPGREQGRPAELVGDALLHRAGVEQQRLRAPPAPSRGARRRGRPGVGCSAASHGPASKSGIRSTMPSSAGIACTSSPCRLAHRRRHRQRPRRVHLGAEGGVDDDPPVAELVAEPLDHDRAVVGDVAGGLALLAQVADQVVGRPRVEPAGGQPGARLLVRQGVELADELADGAAELERAADLVAVPERQPSGLARARG